MAKVTNAYRIGGTKPVIICDFTPPRGTGSEYLDNARKLDVDFISVAYNPGKAVRVDSAMLAYTIKERTGKDVLFNLATRDMNRLALESHLLGASLLGLENLLILGGDPFSRQDLKQVRDVSDFTKAARRSPLFRPLGQCAMDYALQGVTSLQEVARVAATSEVTS